MKKISLSVITKVLALILVITTGFFAARMVFAKTETPHLQQQDYHDCLTLIVAETLDKLGYPRNSVGPDPLNFSITEDVGTGYLSYSLEARNAPYSERGTRQEHSYGSDLEVYTQWFDASNVIGEGGHYHHYINVGNWGFEATVSYYEHEGERNVDVGPLGVAFKDIVIQSALKYREQFQQYGYCGASPSDDHTEPPHEQGLCTGVTCDSWPTAECEDNSSQSQPECNPETGRCGFTDSVFCGEAGCNQSTGFCNQDTGGTNSVPDDQCGPECQPYCEGNTKYFCEDCVLYYQECPEGCYNGHCISTTTDDDDLIDLLTLLAAIGGIILAGGGTLGGGYLGLRALRRALKRRAAVPQTSPRPRVQPRVAPSIPVQPHLKGGPQDNPFTDFDRRNGPNPCD